MDLTLAREKQQAFDEWMRANEKKLKIDLNVTVLTTGFWPTYKVMDLALPQEMVDGVEMYKQFYDQEVREGGEKGGGKRGEGSGAPESAGQMLDSWGILGSQGVPPVHVWRFSSSCCS